ncbi:peptide ABC transporter substrate-binding protein, partial [Burkholderia pseudomallei]
AADFGDAGQRLADPQTGSKYTLLVEFVKTATAIIAGKQPPGDLGIRAIAPYTIEVQTEVPVSYVPELPAMAPLPPVNKAAVAKCG